MNIKLNQTLEKFFFYIVISLPILFIFGSAILNISIFLLNLIFIIHIVFNREFDFLKQNKEYLILLVFFLLFQILNNIISQNFLYFEKSLYYIRFLLLPLVFKYFFKFMEFNYYKISQFYLVILLFIFTD